MTVKKYTLAELADILACKLVGDGSITVKGVASLESATSEEASFLANSFLTSPKYVEAMKNSRAAVICIDEKTNQILGKNYLICKDPSQTFQKIAELLLITSKESGFTGIHPTAVIHDAALLGEGVTVGPHAVIDRDVKVGENTFIGANSYIGCASSLGDDVYIHPHCTVRERCILKNRVILQPGAVIGSCGFGYIPDEKGRHIKLEQLGIVILEDDVEIGANTAIDRARFKATIIRRGTKIDNLVQVAHNVEIGEDNIFAAQTGIAGSSKTGKHVMLGGQVGVLGHVEITDHVLIATRGGVSKTLKKPGRYRGSPAIDVKEYNKEQVHVRKLASYLERIKELEEKVSRLEER